MRVSLKYTTRAVLCTALVMAGIVSVCVVPAYAGTQNILPRLDSRFCGNDKFFKLRHARAPVRVDTLAEPFGVTHGNGIAASLRNFYATPDARRFPREERTRKRGRTISGTSCPGEHAPTPRTLVRGCDNMSHQRTEVHSQRYVRGTVGDRMTIPSQNEGEYGQRIDLSDRAGARR